MRISRPKRIRLARPTLLLVAGAIGLAGARERVIVGRPELTAVPAVGISVDLPPPTAAASLAPVSPTPVSAASAPPAPAPLPGIATDPREVAKDPFAVVTGEASYYAPGFEGRRTASGAPFRNEEMLAAHRDYPFGTVLRVTNTANGRSVEVTVVDRGPFGKETRILDLSRAAAERLGYLRQGHAKVRVEVISIGDGSGG